MVQEKEMAVAERIYAIMENGEGRSGTAFQIGIVALIILNILFVIIETEESVYVLYGKYMETFATISLIIFTGEYILRLSLYRHKTESRRFALVRFAASPMMIIDLIVIMPLFLPFLGVDTRLIRILRLLRLFTVFKLARMSESMSEFATVIKSRTSDFVLAFSIFFIVLILASSFMYYIEREAQPEVFYSIPASMWWGIVTLTTIGYGDTVPVTPIGKAIGAGVAILGIAVYAVPTGIIATSFNEYRRSRKGTTCPHCGRPIDLR
ncbi:MAG: ion transporter [Cenarchaeum sp. SB0665_bin_23]|nr:ion transporter [Cenarchaeum sp. SB0667_bin_13]MXY38166.1 ion transporter [Cenarchaeum sp. SB0664_bin_35]MXY60990.1 ion transporter [Cenarchaeum sp. SB0665_bin_23]MXZ93700.1 ion transporter [Cenarchaeum sp. SB0666_bin_15]MYB46490.1 ion transporter [Cenarchaeum sp. SB0662_bin_33]MYC79706.1 ion transporter [Cenarchaeum sp. SB0661_bin_35]MYD58899.1 ion transporter [Cenarchaeum sp. SB0678_bin_8]MYG33409.1 ion transporter [Cenarchaeum sp. SB0677_bin_16]MYI51619.1 ion transporter [Cenarchaeum 